MVKSYSGRYGRPASAILARGAATRTACWSALSTRGCGQHTPVRMRVGSSTESVALAVLSVASMAAIVAWSPPAAGQLLSRLGPENAFCAPGQTPAFMDEFAALRAQLGNVMGAATECPHSDNGTLEPSLRQATTTGTAVYFPTDNLPTFALGFEHWALEEENLVYWSSQSLHPPPRREPGTLLFQAGWPSDPSERPTAGNRGWKTSAGMLINHGDTGSMDRVEGAPTLGRSAAIEAQMRVDADGDGAFGIWRQRVKGTYRLGYTAGTLFIASDSTADGFAPPNLLIPRALASADFWPGDDWHTYRFEATRTHFRGFVDGDLLVEVEDDRFPGEVGNGVWTEAAAVSVRDYRLLER
jgi:hypothetical protein